MSGRMQAIAVIGLLAVVLLIIVRQISRDDAETPGLTPIAIASASASESASATASAGGAGELGEETSVFELENGDCFSVEGDQVETVTVVGCEDPHVYEVFAVFDHEAGGDEPYPGDDALLEYADAECQPHFEEYVGIDYESSIYWITSVTPSEATWAEGDDREIVCTLKLGEEGEQTTGSAEGAGQ